MAEDKRKLFIIFLGVAGIILFLVVLSILSGRSDEAVLEDGPAVGRESGRIDLPAGRNVSVSEGAEPTPGVPLSLPDGGRVINSIPAQIIRNLPETAPSFELHDSNALDKARGQLVADNLKIGGAPRLLPDRTLSWVGQGYQVLIDEANNALWIFNLEYQPQIAPSEAEALSAGRNFLRDNGLLFPDLRVAEDLVRPVYIDSHEMLTEPELGVAFNAVQLPLVRDTALPTFSGEDEYLRYLIIGEGGRIISAKFFYRELDLSSVNERPTLGFDQVLRSIEQGQAQVYPVDPEVVYADIAGQVETLELSDVSVQLLETRTSGMLVPVYVISATATLSNGAKVPVKLVVQAS